LLFISVGSRPKTPQCGDQVEERKVAEREREREREGEKLKKKVRVGGFGKCLGGF